MRKLPLFLSLLFMLSCTAALAFPFGKKPKKTLVVATYSFLDNNRLSDIQPMAWQMAKAVGANLQLKSYRTAGQLAEAMWQGQADVAFMDPFGYLLLQTDARPLVTPLAVLQKPAGSSDGYTSCLIASKASGVESLEELRDSFPALNLVLAEKQSVAGNLVPRLLLSSLDVKEPERQFKRTEYAGSHAGVLDEVKKGVADVGALGWEEYAKQLASGALKEDEVALIWRSEEVPLGPVVCRTSLSAKKQRKLQQVLLRAQAKNPEALSQLKRAWPGGWEAGGFAPVSETHYALLRRVAGGQPDLRRVLEQHFK